MFTFIWLLIDTLYYDIWEEKFLKVLQSPYFMIFEAEIRSHSPTKKVFIFPLFLSKITPPQKKNNISKQNWIFSAKNRNFLQYLIKNWNIIL